MTGARWCVCAAAVGLLLPGGAGGAARTEALVGVGPSLSAPLFQEWSRESARAGGAAIRYRAVEAGAVVSRITTHAADFGTNGLPLTATQARAAQGLLRVPIAAEPVAVAYHVPGVGPGLRLTGGILGDIYGGRITRWDDPRVARLNPDLHLPPLSIVPCHSGDARATASFTRFLGEAWRGRIGAGSLVRWPVGPGDADDAGVAARVQRTPGSLGYFALIYAVMRRTDCAALRNGAGRFVPPDLASATLAVESAAGGAEGEGGYPLTGITLLLAPRVGSKPALRRFLKWALTEGQKSAPGLLYAPLPVKTRRQALATVAAMR